MIKKLGGMYDTPTWKKESGDEIVQKVNRIFPSTDTSLGGLYKHKKEKAVGTLDKVEGTPEHVLIMNTDIRGKKIGELENIDYEWYIAEAQKRIDDFIRNKKETRKKEKNGGHMNSAKEFLNERYEAILSMKKKKIIAYCEKYDIKIPQNEETFWAKVHKTICNLYFSDKTLISSKRFEKSYNWLNRHGYSPFITNEDIED